MGVEFVVLFSFRSWYFAVKSSNDTFFVQSIIIWVIYGNVFIQRTLKSWLLETKRTWARGRRNKKFHIINTDRQYEKARICFQTRRASTPHFIPQHICCLFHQKSLPPLPDFQTFHLLWIAHLGACLGQRKRWSHGESGWP